MIAVLEFYLSQARRPDARELKLPAAVAAQLGSLIRRRRSEERLSLSYHKHLPIDQSFVRDGPYDPDDAAIATAVITMAHSLGIEAVAEGVEPEDQIAFLLERGCDTGQGFAYCRPVPASGIARLIEDGPLCAES